MALQLVTPPATEPISLVEAKRHCRIDHDDDDATVTFLISVAVQYIDARSGWLGRALITQTWRLVVDAFPVAGWCGWTRETTPPAAIKIPWPPLQSVTSVKYIDVNGDQQTMSPADYMVDNVSEPGWLIPLTTWPAIKATANAVEIEFVAGYGDDAADVVAPIRHALLLLIGHLYENREQVIAQYEGNASALPLPYGVEHLLSPFRQILV